MLLPVLAVAVALGAVPAVLGGEGDGAWMFAYVAIVAVLAGVALLVAAARATGRLRLAWGLLASSCFMAGVVLGQLTIADRPTAASWVPRLLASILAAVALAAFPGTVTGLQRWVLLGLDGWLLGGSVFVGLWLATVPGTRLVDSPEGLALGSIWLLGDLALVSTVLALTLRLPKGTRTGGAALALVGVALAHGDLYRAFVGDGTWTPITRAAYVGSWTAAGVLLAATPWLAHSPFRAGTMRVPTSPGLRLPYLVACVAIAATTIAWAFGRPSDPLLSAVVLTLLWSLVTSQVLLAIENRRLVSQVSRQADMFRTRATQDGLTGLPNRSEFTGRVEAALHGPHRGHVAVLFIDLDGFKDVNDSFGHAVGDELLIETATRLAAEVRETDVVARFGGDEFVALLNDCSDETAVEVAERLRASLSVPYRIGHRDVVVSASIGLSQPGEDDDAESALRNADLALYRAKESGRDRVSVFEPGMHASALRRLDAAGRLRHALAHDRLSLAYQPIVDLRTGEIYAVEALLRFDHEDFSDWTVTEVIEAAEESGLIVPVGGWVLDSAVQMLGQWLRSGISTRLNVNVSARQLEAGGELAQQVENALICHRVPAEALCLEITEHQLVRDLDHTTVELDKIRRLGVRVALDDFGTGYSSLSYLPRLPLDALKIDRDLTSRVGSARDTLPAVLRLGRDLGLAVVVEGIERHDQLELLRASGAVLGQGHLLSLPLGERAATDLLRQGVIRIADMVDVVS
jgi:diguanylate cyclase (GGDEF)-like protein